MTETWADQGRYYNLFALNAWEPKQSHFWYFWAISIHEYDSLWGYNQKNMNE